MFLCWVKHILFYYHHSFPSDYVLRNDFFLKSVLLLCWGLFSSTVFKGGMIATLQQATFHFNLLYPFIFKGGGVRCTVMRDMKLATLQFSQRQFS